MLRASPWCRLAKTGQMVTTTGDVDREYPVCARHLRFIFGHFARRRPPGHLRPAQVVTTPSH